MQNNSVDFNLKSLTGLRGLAVLIVFISHLANENLVPSFLGNGFGQIGVMLFFVLSSFLMGKLYLGLVCNEVNLQNYIFARAGRIVPLYYFILLLSICGYAYEIDGLTSFFKHILFLKGEGVLWAIPVEVQFYSLFVLLWIMHNKKKLLPFLGIVVFASTLITFYQKQEYDFVSGLNYCIFYFSAGVLISLCYQRRILFLFSEKYLSFINRLAISIFSICLFLISIPSFRSLTNFDYIGMWYDPLLLFTVVLFFICALYNMPMFSYLSSKPFMALGEISFGFYLFHYPVIYLYEHIFLKESQFEFLLILFIFITTYALAKISYIFFEKPLSKKIRELKAK